MKQSNYTIQIIEPSEGFYLTRKDNKGYILSKKVFLAINDSPDNWEEIEESEGESLHEILLEKEKELADNN